MFIHVSHLFKAVVVLPINLSAHRILIVLTPLVSKMTRLVETSWESPEITSQTDWGYNSKAAGC